MKVLQILIGLVVATFLIFTVVVGFSINSAEDIIKDTVESVARQLTQTEFDIKESDFDLNQGGGLLKTIRLDNLEGFSNDPLMTVGEMLVTLDINSAKKRVKVIKQLEVNNISLLHEINKKGESNLELMLDTIAKEFIALEKTPNKKVRLMIETLIVGDVDITLSQNGQRSNTTLMAYTENNIGSAGVGLSSEELAKALFDSLLTRVLN